jgi:hypothetical protein
MRREGAAPIAAGMHEIAPWATEPLTVTLARVKATGEWEGTSALACDSGSLHEGYPLPP